jgi:DNA primase
MKGHSVQIYGAWQRLYDKTVWVTEGELDAALLMQEFWMRGVDDVVVSTTGGCGADVGKTLNGCAIGYHRAEEYIVIYDQDEPGRKAALAALESLEEAPLVDKCTAGWPEKWGKDVTEAIVNVGFEAWWDYVQTCLH